MILKPALSLLLIWMMLLTVILPTTAHAAPKQDDQADSTDEPGLRFRLSEGVEAAEASTSSSPIATATSLSEVETNKLLARLPALTTDASDTVSFKLRESSLPPPRTGKTIQAAFAPPADGPPNPVATRAPLEVTRFTPDGEVALAPMMTITFSQPMVAVASQEEAAANVPVVITPQPQGKWRWLGTQTLMFQPSAEGGRMPMATNYTVTVPAGTKSALGNALPQTKTFNFATPPLTLKTSYPDGESRPRDEVMFLEFDQRIDAARVLEHLKLEPLGSDVHLRLATAEEIAGYSYVRDFAKEAQEGRWLAFRAIAANGTTKDALPANTGIKVVIPPGTPSAEGTRTTLAEQSFKFRTYGPLRVVDAQCGYQKKCSPNDAFIINLSNQLDSAFQPAQVKITPEMPKAQVVLYGGMIRIDGYKRSNTTYTVTLDRGIKDIFGQTLTGDNQITFNVTTNPPGLFSLGGNFVVLDPAGPRSFTVYSINFAQLRMKLYKVTADDWLQFQKYQVVRYNGQTLPPPPGQLISDKVIDIPGDADQLTETAIDLSPALNEGYGHVFILVEPVEDKTEAVNVYAYRQNLVEAWVQSTEIGLDAFVDNNELVVWTNSLKDGNPLAGIEVNVSPDDLAGTSGTNGLIRLPFKDSTKTNDKPSLIVGRRGKDVAILSQEYATRQSAHSPSWRASFGSGYDRWYVFDDRKLYRPSEEVNIKGWIRNINLTPTGDTELYVPNPEKTLNYMLEDSQENQLAKGTVKLNALAGFNIKVQLPPTMNLGEATVKFQFGDLGSEYDPEDSSDYEHNFQVQEFRRPEFEITTAVSEGPYFVGTSATVKMTAAYYTGGGLAGTDVDWTVTSAPTNYTPPNRDDYIFGKFFPWWGHGYYEGSKQQSFKGRTNGAGKHSLKIDFDGVNPARPSNVSVEARVQDVNRQTIAGSSSLLVHPADVYVGLKPSRYFVQKGDPFDIATIVTDLDGKALVDRDVQLRFIRLEWVYEQGVWSQPERDVQEQTVKSGAGAVNVRFKTTEGGMYRLTAQVRDGRERLNESELTLWVAGGKLPPQREVAQEKVELIPDRRNYADGNVAEILVQSPFVPAEGVMTIRRSGLLRTERFTMNESSYTLRVPIAEAMTPSIVVQVDLVGAGVRVDDQGTALPSLPKRSAFASGEINLEVPPTMRRLSVTATPRATVLEPGAETVIDVEVKDAQGRGVAGTDTAVVVVDESVLALTNYKLADPLSYFYEVRGENVNDYHLREKISLANPNEIKRHQAGDNNQNFSSSSIVDLSVGGQRTVQALYSLAPGAMSATVEVTSDGSSSQEVSVRQNFNALAVFAASFPTDARGRAQVKVKLPDNLTRYRVMAVSVSGGKLAGQGASAITARKQLMARPSAPRFLNYGDQAELPVVLQNQTDQATTVNVAVRATNANLTAGAGRRVTVPANNRVEVRFPIAAVKPGTARFQIVAASAARTDAAEISLPVYTPATTEAFATYGVIDEGSIAQPVKAPADVVETFGGLEITTASTQLQELTDAVIYLVNYPYSCSEQTSSRIIAVAALKDVLTAFKSKDLPAPEALRDSVARDLKRLQGMQNEDGGFGFWQRGERSFPYVSVHVAHALVRAKSKGFTVSEEMLNNSKEYLRKIEEKIPKEYSIESRRAIQAYALFVRALMEDRDTAKARKLIAEAGGVEKLSMESLGWLLPVVSGDAASVKETEAIRRHFNNRVTETAGAAHFADSYSDGAYTLLQSDRRADGVILDALIGDQPQSDLIPKLVRGLLGGRRHGCWTNTQENVFILLALDRYFNVYEHTTPDFVARVWLGKGYAGEQAFKGRSLDRQQLNLPMSVLVERTAAGPVNLTIDKAGAGRLYFRVGTRYAPANLKLAAADYGFQIERKYEAIDNPGDVQREPDGTWVIKAGARVRVRVTMSNPARRYHVALVDPLPAGLEALNPELATTESVPDGSNETRINRSSGSIYDYYWSWRGPWYEHQNLRDERVEAFTSLLWEGVHEYTYFARATTPGVFVVPPSKAEEMYAPETFGRGHSDRVQVK